MKRYKRNFVQELPLVIWLAVVWVALWQDFSVGNIVVGLLLAFAVTRVFYLPPVQLSGRFNVGYFLVFIFIFLWRVISASVQVIEVEITKGPRVKNAIVAAPLLTRSDLLITLTGHLISLIPGSLIIEVDRSTATLYLHALDVETAEDAQKIRDEVNSAEAWVIRIMGSKEELAALRANLARRRVLDNSSSKSAGSEVL